MSRLPPSDEASAACREVVEKWRQEKNIETNLDEPTHQLASRVRSWINDKSVAAGVQDVMGAFLKEVKDPEALGQLGEALGRRLMKDGLLVASVRRGGGGVAG